MLPRPPWAGSGDLGKSRSFVSDHRLSTEADKLRHYEVSRASVVAIGRLLLHAGCDSETSLSTAAAVTLFGGVVKELVDHLRAGGSGFDPRDLLADLLGVRGGLAVLSHHRFGER